MLKWPNDVMILRYPGPKTGKMTWMKPRYPGSPDLMRWTLERLARVSDRGVVVIHVVPHAAGALAAELGIPGKNTPSFPGGWVIINNHHHHHPPLGHFG